MNAHDIAHVVATADFGQPTAVKRGRDARWPYVPVIDHGTHTEQIRKRAFATRDEALADAVAHIEACRRSLAAKLADPRFRALREQHGLPREIPREIVGT